MRSNSFKFQPQCSIAAMNSRSRDFSLLVFSLIIFPQASDFPCSTCTMPSRVLFETLLCSCLHLKILFETIVTVDRRCHWHKLCTFSCIHLRESSKKFEMAVREFIGIQGKMLNDLPVNTKRLPVLHRCSVADQGCFSGFRIRLFSIPDPNLFHPGSGFATLHRTDRSIT